MSRIGKKPIQIPEKVVFVKKGEDFSARGPLGEITRVFPSYGVKINLGEKEINLTLEKNSKLAKALWGTYASHFLNMIEGITKGFEKKLLIEGVGYRYQIEGANVKLNIGYSHPVFVSVPNNLKVTCEKNMMTIFGVDKEAVGQFAASIRSLKKPEPYKGKGIRYENEVIRRKAGKKVGVTS